MLVVLVTLVAVAIPKYRRLQGAVAKKAAESGVAAGVSACSMLYSRALLDKAVTFSCTNAADEVHISDDITVAIVASGNVCIITSTIRGQNAVGIWLAP
ncbi:putative prepilin-type N-terminal cleavage/methylation domain-containing protein [Desulfovibrionales bacterium]